MKLFLVPHLLSSYRHMVQTSIFFLAALFGCLCLIACASLAVLSRRHKSSQRDFKLVGQIACVKATLQPEGSVLVNGELWRARTEACEMITPSHGPVRIVGARGYLLIVERAG